MYLERESDGQIGHGKQEIEAYLQVFVSHQQDDWADWILLVEFVYNNKVHVATHQTPFELNARQHLHLGVEPTKMSTVEATDTFTKRLDHAQEEGKAALDVSLDDMN